MNKFQKLVGLVIISFFILFIACSKSKEPTEDISKLDNKEAITNEVITNNNDSNQTSENDSEEISSDNMIISMD